MRPIGVDPLERARAIVYDYALRSEARNDEGRRGPGLVAYSSARQRFTPLPGIALFAVATTVASALVVLAAIVWFFSA